MFFDAKVNHYRSLTYRLLDAHRKLKAANVSEEYAIAAEFLTARYFAFWMMWAASEAMLLVSIGGAGGFIVGRMVQ